MIHELIRDAEAEEGDHQIMVVEGFENGSAETTSQGPFFHGDNLADASSQWVDQGFIQGPQEARINHRCLDSISTEKVSGGQGATDHGAIGNDQQVIASPQNLTTADLEGFPAFLHQGHTLSWTSGDSKRCGAWVFKACHQHALKLRFVTGRHHREVGDGTEVADVVLALMSRAVGSDNASAVENERDRKILDADVVNQLVVGTLKKGAVNGHNGFEAFTGHSARKGHGMLLGNPHIDVLLGNRFLQHVEAGAGGHGCGDPDDATVLFAELDQRLTENLAVAGWLGGLAGSRLAGFQIEG